MPCDLASSSICDTRGCISLPDAVTCDNRLKLPFLARYRPGVQSREAEDGVDIFIQNTCGLNALAYGDDRMPLC